MNERKVSTSGMVADVAAEVSKAKAVLQSVQTYVEYHFQDGDYGDIQALVNLNAGNIQVLLHVIAEMLDKAEATADELDKALHEKAEKRGAA